MDRGIESQLVDATSSPQFWIVAIALVAVLVGSRLFKILRRPAPGDVWFAEVPFVNGSGSKDRPVLVLSVEHGAIKIATFTSQDKSRRRDHVRVPVPLPGQMRSSWVSLEPTHIRRSALRRRVVKGDALLLGWYLRASR